MHPLHHPEVLMTAITLRNLPPELAEFIEAKARADQRSLNQTVIQLLHKAAGMAKGKEPEIEHHDLDHLSGALTREEADELDEAIRWQRQIDPEMWK
jgi:hypothetical protein